MLKRRWLTDTLLTLADIPPEQRDEIRARLEAKTTWEPTSGCQLWLAGTNKQGYGSMSVLGRMRVAHRVSWVLARGDCPPGTVLDHKCRNVACVNPAHLEPVSPKVNALRGVGPSAVNAAKSHCKRGHALVESNVYRSQGKRCCRACNLAHQERYRRLRRSA